MMAGGKNSQKVSVPLRKAFLYSLANNEDVENLEEMLLRRESCSLCLMQAPSESLDSKVLAVGGHFDATQGEYQGVCELFDLQLDVWKQTARLKVERLNPFVVALDQNCALVLGGIKEHHMTKKQKLIFEAEIIDIENKKAYYPFSHYKLPEGTFEILGLFKLSQDSETAKFVEELDGSSKIVRESQQENQYLETESVDESQDMIDPNEEKVDSKIEIVSTKLILVLLMSSNQVTV